MYNPYGQQPMYQQPGGYGMSRMQQVLRVNGKNGVDALQMPPNSSVLALDTNAPIVWLVQTDGAGYKSPTPYSITPYQQEPPIDAKGLETRLARLEEIVNGWKPDPASAGAAQRGK